MTAKELEAQRNMIALQRALFIDLFSVLYGDFEPIN
jgi:hypothetical protein